jgi:hypothetical protein
VPGAETESLLDAPGMGAGSSVRFEYALVGLVRQMGLPSVVIEEPYHLRRLEEGFSDKKTFQFGAFFQQALFDLIAS